MLVAFKIFLEGETLCSIMRLFLLSVGVYKNIQERS